MNLLNMFRGTQAARALARPARKLAIERLEPRQMMDAGMLGICGVDSRGLRLYEPSYEQRRREETAEARQLAALDRYFEQLGSGPSERGRN
jgi:hypothetical protein